MKYLSIPFFRFNFEYNKNKGIKQWPGKVINYSYGQSSILHLRSEVLRFFLNFGIGEWISKITK